MAASTAALKLSTAPLLQEQLHKLQAQPSTASLHNSCVAPAALRSTSSDGPSISSEALSLLVRTAPPGHQLDPPLHLTLPQLQSVGSSALGWQVLVQSTDGSYVGYLCWLLDHCSRLGLEQVSRPESGVRRVGLVLLYYRTILSITLLARRSDNPRHTKQKSNVLEERHGRSLLMKKLVPPHLVNKRKEEEEEEQLEGPAPPLPSPVGRLSRPNTWRLVDALDHGYTDAVRVILQCRCVGVSVFGHKLGRWGALAWLCVATPDTVYLFDAATLGLYRLLHGRENNTTATRGTTTAADKRGTVHQEIKDGLADREERREAGADGAAPTVEDKADSAAESRELTCCPEDADTLGEETREKRGRIFPDVLLTRQRDDAASGKFCGDADLKSSYLTLARVFADPALEIVMHDVRNFYDFLQHNLNISIEGLYDTQATEVYLHILQHRGDCPAFVPSLAALLTRHLPLLSPQHLLYNKLHIKHQGDSSVYLERPLPRATLSGLASSAVFLCELRHQQQRELLADLRQLTALHASAHALRDDVTRARVEQHVVPASVQQLGRRTVLNCLPGNRRW